MGTADFRMEEVNKSSPQRFIQPVFDPVQRCVAATRRKLRPLTASQLCFAVQHAMLPKVGTR